MRLLLINPPSDNPMGELKGIEPPVWCVYLAALLRKQGHEVLIWDAEIEFLSQDRAQDKPLYKARDKLADVALVVAMGNNPSASSTPKMPRAKNVAGYFREAGIPTDIIGLHTLAIAEENQTGFTFPSAQELSGIQIPAWDLVDLTRYRAHNWHCFGKDRGNYASIYTSFGCAFNCSFCNIHTLYGGRKVYYRESQDVLAEIDVLVKRGVRNLKICDELFTLNKKRAYKLCKELAERDYKLNIWAYAKVGTVDEDLLEMMKRAGINWLSYGFESFNKDVLKGSHKRTEYKDAVGTIKITRLAGINIMANFIFGLPGDTEKSMKRTLKYAERFLFEYVNFYLAMPYPGSSLYNENCSADWSRYSQFSPNPLSPPEIVKFRDEAFVHYFSNPAYLEMMRERFGEEVILSLKEMVGRKIR